MSLVEPGPELEESMTCAGESPNGSQLTEKSTEDKGKNQGRDLEHQNPV